MKSNFAITSNIMKDFLTMCNVLIGVQLWRCLQCFEMPDVQVLEQSKQRSDSPKSRLPRTSLTLSRQLLNTLIGHHHWVTAVAITPDGKHSISGSWDNTVKVWDLTTGAEILTLCGHSALVSTVAVTPDGKLVISGSADNTIKVWNLETGEELFTLKGHKELVRAVAVTPDGKRLISGSVDRTIKIWDLESGRKLCSLLNDDERYSRIENPPEAVFSVTVSPDGKRLISGSNEGTIRVWNLETREFLFTIRGHTAGIAMALLVLWCRWYFKLQNNQLVEARKHDLWLISLAYQFIYRRDIATVVVTPDSKQIVSASLDKTVKVWDLETGKELFTLMGHTDSVLTASVTPNGKQIISGSLDKTLKVWNLDC